MKTKVTKDTIPQDFTLSLALFDFLPVLFFSLDMIIIGKLFSSFLFMLGSFLMLFAGICKVLWKIIVVTKKINIWFLFIQMRVLMPIGLILMIIGIIIKKDSFNLLLNTILQMPTILFFIIGIACMILMIVFMFKLDGEKSKNNWLEQTINLIAQLSFFIGLLTI